MGCFISGGWLTRLSTEAPSIFRRSMRDHEIIDMSLYHEFCGDAVAQLEKPEFEDWQGLRLHSRVNDVTMCNTRKTKECKLGDTSGYKVLSMFCITVIARRVCISVTITVTQFDRHALNLIFIFETIFDVWKQRVIISMRP